MIYLNMNDVESLAKIVAELVKLNMNVIVVESVNNKWQIEVTN
jgi:hypothetical protein